MVSTMTQEEKVRLRAFELFEKRGRQKGHELDDWLKAEKEIRGFNGEIKTKNLIKNGGKSRHYN
jgi:hypothetical protein